MLLVYVEIFRSLSCVFTVLCNSRVVSICEHFMLLQIEDLAIRWLMLMWHVSSSLSLIYKLQFTNPSYHDLRPRRGTPWVGHDRFAICRHTLKRKSKRSHNGLVYLGGLDDAHKSDWLLARECMTADRPVGTRRWSPRSPNPFTEKVVCMPCQEAVSVPRKGGSISIRHIPMGRFRQWTVIVSVWNLPCWIGRKSREVWTRP